jgi:cyanophycin synthetase
MFYPETRKYLEPYNPQQMKVLMVTGTKGKTSIITMCTHVVNQLSKNTFLVNTTGVYWNQQNILTNQDSIRNFGKSPTVMPGRFLHGFFMDKDIDFSTTIATLESSFSSGIYGTGLIHHDVGILTNIYVDHIDGERIKSQDDIYLLKSFIFREIKPGGIFVVNLDQDYGLKAVSETQKLNKQIKIKGFTLQGKDKAQELYDNLDLFDVYFADQGQAMSIKKGLIFDMNKFPYYFGDGYPKFIVQNLLIVFASLDELFTVEDVGESLETFKFPESYGRLQFYQSDKKVLVIDYAHEIESLAQMIELIKHRYKRKITLVTRVAPDRSEKFLKQFAKDLATLPIDRLVFYDKIDGKKRKTYRSSAGKVLKPGDIMNFLLDQVLAQGADFKVDGQIAERDALINAVNSGEVVLHIVNDVKGIKDSVQELGMRRVL